PVYSCGGKNRKFPFRFISWYRAFENFNKIKKENKIDFIHSFWFFEAALLGSIFSYLFKIPYLNTLMGQDVLKQNKYLSLIPKKNIKFIAISKRQERIFKENSKKEADVIPFGISKKDFLNKSNSEREIDILGVGSLIELKNYKLFINVIKNLVETQPDIKCVLIGEGEQKNFLFKLIKEFKLENNIRLTGKLSRKEVFNYMQKSKNFFHPSKYESLGYVYEEALMFGLTIVSLETGIAEASNKWKVCKNEEEIYIQLKQLLKYNLDYTPLVPYPIEDTVKAYFKIYNS
ncbi:MAG: glycosyltransferase, partial [Ignavibacteriaceae bacterium]